VLKCSAGLVTVATVNFDLLVEFYSQLLGQSPAPYRAGVYAGFQVPGLELGIFQPAPERQAAFTPPSQSVRICLEVQNLDEAFATLAGTVAGEIIAASHGREFYARDPDGNWLILHQGWSAPTDK
jgi:predicted enzyme related to lactoylglutathione lyase